MRLYYEVAKRSLRRQMAYRAANWAGFITNTFFGCLRSYVFLALFAVRPEVVGYQIGDALAYVWLTQALLMFAYLWGWWDVAVSIRSGQVATDLVKPFDYYWFWLSHDAGRALYHLIFRGIPTFTAGVLLFGVAVPTSPTRWAAFFVSLACAEGVSFGFRFLVNLSAFWLLDYRGIGMVAMISSSFFSGILLPIAFFPDWLRAISDVLPFQGMLYLPASILLGQTSGPDLAWAIGQQITWFVALALLGRALLGLATRRLVLQGG